MRWLSLVLFFAIPALAHGAIVINEVAWMGSSESANDEWIELHNTGSNDVSVEGWALEDGMNLSIALTGIIPAGGYAVLERTDDTSAAGSAFLIYAGALTNTGATLVLRTQDGAIEDQISGGENWESIGGDNTTKETAQYTNAGWITAVATPGRANANESSNVEEDESTSGSLKTTTTKSVKKDEVLQLTLPNVELALSIKGPDIVYVHQTVPLTVEASGLGKTFLESLKYAWNFGDMETAGGKEVSHVFEYPGEYVVTVQGEFARHKQIARKTITVLPVTFSITRNLRGDVQIHNNAKYEVNISRYTVVGTKEVVMPKHSILLPNATLTVAKEKLGVTEGTYIQLLDQEHTLVAAYSSGMLPSTSVFVSETPVVYESLTPSANAVIQEPEAEDFGFSNEQIEVTEEAEVEASTIPVATVVESGETIPKDALPMLGLIGVMSMGILAVFIRKKEVEVTI